MRLNEYFMFADLNFHLPATSPPMLVPSVIHSEEHDLTGAVDTSGRSGGASSSNSGTVTNKSDNIGSSKIVGSDTSSRTNSGTSSGGTVRTGIRGGSGAQTYNKSPPSSTEHPYDGSGNESNEHGGSRSSDYDPHYTIPDYNYKNLDFTPVEYYETRVDDPKIDKPHQGVIQSDSSKQAALIISIVAGILIIIIIIILIVLKCNGKGQEISKIEEAKTYASLSQGPTMIVNGQGNGTVKAGDRRPVKKERKDVKEWYV